jgi:hypothetical protein
MQFIKQHLSFPKGTPSRGIGMPAQYILAFFVLTAILPACKTKEGCTGAQKAAYTNSMATKKHGKSGLFPKAMAKKIKH